MQRRGRGRTNTAPTKTGSCDNIDEKCGAILFPGDLTFTGFDINTSSDEDRIVLTTIVPITKNTAFIITNAVYEAGAAAYTRTNRWYANNGQDNAAIAAQKIVYIGDTIIPPGTNICFDLPATGTGDELLAQAFSIEGQNSKYFCVSNVGNTPNPKINIKVKPLEISPLFLMQGDWTFESDHATFCGRILSGLMMGKQWVAFEEDVPPFSKLSRVPFQIECFPIQAVPPPTLIAAYYKLLPQYKPIQFLALATNFQNWTIPQTNDSSAACKQSTEV